MMLKKNLIRGYHLYAIVDKDFLKGNEIPRIAECALSAGADMVQLRDKTSSISDLIKTAKELKKITRKYNAPFIVNDRLEAALAVDADGLHIGQGDIDISLAKRLMGRDKLIGVSVKNPKQAREAKDEGADYLGVGPVFKTPIKPDIKPKGLRLLNEVKKMNMPFFAIGGIDCANIRKLVKRGFKNVAVVRAICKAKDPYTATRRLREAVFLK